MSHLNLTAFVDLTGSPSFDVLDNDRVAALTGLKAERVWKSTRMTKRHILKEDKLPVDIALEVFDKLMAELKITPRQCRGIGVLHTDYDEGNTAFRIAKRIAHERGIFHGQIFGSSYGCAGFVKLLEEAVPHAHDLNEGEHFPLITVETPERFLDAHDQFGTPIFAAGAAATSFAKDDGHRLIDAQTQEVVPPKNPDNADVFRFEKILAEDFYGNKAERHVIRMNGDLAYANGAALIEQSTRDALSVLTDLGLVKERRVLVVPHQANARMINAFDQTIYPSLAREVEAKALRFANGMEGMGNVI